MGYDFLADSVNYLDKYLNIQASTSSLAPCRLM